MNRSLTFSRILRSQASDATLREGGVRLRHDGGGGDRAESRGRGAGRATGTVYTLGLAYSE